MNAIKKAKAAAAVAAKAATNAALATQKVISKGATPVVADVKVETLVVDFGALSVARVKKLKDPKNPWKADFGALCSGPDADAKRASAVQKADAVFFAGIGRTQAAAFKSRNDFGYKADYGAFCTKEDADTNRAKAIKVMMVHNCKTAGMKEAAVKPFLVESGLFDVANATEEKYTALGRACGTGQKMLALRASFLELRVKMKWKLDYGKMTSSKKASANRAQAESDALDQACALAKLNKDQMKGFLLAPITLVA